MALGITTAAGSLGQVAGPPLAQYLLSGMHWSQVFMVFAAIIMASVLCLPFLKSEYKASKAELEDLLARLSQERQRPQLYYDLYRLLQLWVPTGLCDSAFPRPLSQKPVRQLTLMAFWQALALPLQPPLVP